MAYNVRFIPEQNLVLVVAYGRLFGEEIVSSARKMFADERWTRTIDQVVDVRNVSGMAVTYDHIRQIIDVEMQFDQKIGPGKQALVARTDTQYSICLFYKGIVRVARRPQTVGVFRAMEDALIWLGKEADIEAILAEQA